MTLAACTENPTPSPVVVAVTSTGEPTATATPSPAATPTQTPTATPETPTDQPQAIISPTSGPPGTTVQVSARGFPGDTSVQVGAGVINTEFGTTETAQTDAQGRVDTQLVIPDFAQPGERWVVIVRVVERGGAKATSEVFQITGGATASPTPEAALFERTNIYLIALEDNGQSGKEIGCNDSVVPVEVEIEPTVAPLTAALETLLSIDERLYGQSGLYNALYRSDLRVESVAIEAGEAIIHLSGTLSLGGTCDTPRVKAQIQETALQYSTVETVAVFINDRPLEEIN